MHRAYYKQANKSRFPVVVGTSIIFVTVLNVAFAVTAYLFYGENTKQNVRIRHACARSPPHMC
jgi:amino acid permease